MYSRKIKKSKKGKNLAPNTGIPKILRKKKQLVIIPRKRLL